MGKKERKDFYLLIRSEQKSFFRATLKYQQAQLFGKCQTLFVGKKYAAFAHALEQLAEVEQEFREALMAR